MSSHLVNGRPPPRHGIVTATGSKSVAGFHAVVFDGHVVGLCAMCRAWSHRRWHTPRDQSSTRCWRNAAANRALIRRMVSSQTGSKAPGPGIHVLGAQGRQIQKRFRLSMHITVRQPVDVQGKSDGRLHIMGPHRTKQRMQNDVWHVWCITCCGRAFEPLRACCGLKRIWPCTSSWVNACVASCCRTCPFEGDAS